MNTIIRLEEKICKKFEESLNIDWVKLEMQSIIEGCKNLIDGSVGFSSKKVGRSVILASQVQFSQVSC